MRLTNGHDNGILQIYKSDGCRIVCSDDWGNLDAAVACRQRGYDGIVCSCDLFKPIRVF